MNIFQIQIKPITCIDVIYIPIGILIDDNVYNYIRSILGDKHSFPREITNCKDKQTIYSGYIYVYEGCMICWICENNDESECLHLLGKQFNVVNVHDIREHSCL